MRGQSLIGKRFGIVEIESTFLDDKGKILCNCKCDCGNTKVIRYETLKAKYFKGHCGCQPHKGKGQIHHYTKVTANIDKFVVTKHSIAKFMSDIKDGKYDYPRSLL